MAAVSGVNQTKIDAGGLANKIASGHKDGRVKVTLDTYPLTTGNLSGDVISLFGTLPAGAKILKIRLLASATQTFTLSVGTHYSHTAFVTASTGCQTANAVLNIPCFQYAISTSTGDNQIIVTTGTATAAAATLYAEVYFVTD